MNKIVTLPGLIDMHVHLRDPGQIHKEDFYSGSSAALAGGFTTIVDMPNNLKPITTTERLDAKIASAAGQAVCDIGFYFGTLGNNFDQFNKVANKVHGLKVYLNLTTGGFIIDKNKLSSIYNAWQVNKPILLHAEDDVSDLVLSTLRANPKPTHICHVSSHTELEFVMRAKEEGLPITCGVTPHHLFLTSKDADKLGAHAHMKPYLKTKTEQDFLWQHLDAVDVIESDHAPHTRSEKASAQPPFGVPGLETTLPLMLTAEAKGKLTRKKLLDLLYRSPAKILGLNPAEDTFIKVDMSEYQISNEGLQTKCGWTPFAGQHVIGKVQSTTIRSINIYKKSKVLAPPGSGKIL